MRTLSDSAALERSLVKRFRKELWQPFIAACKRYALLPEGCHAAALLDGTTASLAMALLLRELQRHSDVPFALTLFAGEGVSLPACVDLPLVPAEGDAAGAARAAGCDRIAAADCMSDAAEAVLTGMLKDGVLRAIPPEEEGGGLRIIRPLYCVEEKDLRAFCRYNGLTFVPRPRDPRRDTARALLEEVKAGSPDAEIRVFRALHALREGTFPPQDR